MQFPPELRSTLGKLVLRAVSNEGAVPAGLNALVGRLARKSPTPGASMTVSLQRWRSLGLVSTILGSVGVASVLGGELIRMTQAQKPRPSNVRTDAAGSPTGEWRSYSGDPGSMRYSALDQINKENVGKLAIAGDVPRWTVLLLELCPPQEVRGQLTTSGRRRS
jgi:glucose dehydrogenase